MKSIVEEASSIVKAVEKAWYSAGKPKEFSVKILEEPQKNFIGLTVKSAKIAILFNDAVSPATQPKASRNKPLQQQQESTKKVKKPASPAPLPKTKPEAQPAKQVKTPQPSHAKSTDETKKPPVESNSPKAASPIWNEAMINTAQVWLTKTLTYVSSEPLKFTIEPHHYHLKIKLEKPIFKEVNRQKQFFASLTTLMLQMLKNKYKRPLRGYKIVITTEP